MNRTALLLLFLLCNLAYAQQLRWAKQVTGNPYSYACAVAIDPLGNVITVGAFHSIADLDPGPAVFAVTSPSPFENTFIQKLDSNGNFLWGASITSNSGSNSPNSIKMDQAGNLYIVGWISGRSDLDIGSGIDSMGSHNLSAYILRLSATGQYLRAGVINNAMLTPATGSDLVLDSAANLYLTGSFRDTVDFDLGPGVQTYPFGGYQDAFVAKYDSSLALQWAIPLSAWAQELGNAIAVDRSGVYAAGRVLDQTDFDPGPGVFLINPGGGASGYVVKYSLGGQFLWAKDMTTQTGDINITGIALDSGGDVIVGGSFEGALDLDPTNGVSMSTPVNEMDIFAARLDSNGNFRWAIDAGSLGIDRVNNVFVDDEGAAYLSIDYEEDIDMDPGPGIVPLAVTISDSAGGALVKLDSVGNFVWVAVLSGNGYEEIYEVWVDSSSSDVYAAGWFTQTVDFAPLPLDTFLMNSFGPFQGFILRWSQDGCTNFGLHFDSIGAVPCGGQPGYMSGHAINGDAPYLYEWNTIPPTLDSFATTLLRGIYTMAVTDDLGCQTQRAVLVDGSLLPNGFDLQANIIADFFQPGDTTTITLETSNSGCVQISDVTKMVLDSQVTFQSATPWPNNVIGDTLVWNFPSMNCDSGHFIAQVIVLTDTTAQSQDTLHFVALTSPSLGDQQPLNNLRNYDFAVANSYDPNAKSVYPPGICDQHYVLRNIPLTYTIQFQNTGTAEALEVAIVDTLDQSLDIATLTIKAHSHPMITEVLAGNVLRFVFHNIHLPDSTTNEPMSHGYVIYEIMPSSSAVPGTEVYNGSAIYFDFNAPVVTNRTMSTLVNAIPSCSIGFAEQPLKQNFRIHPNPSNATVYLHSDIALGDVRISNLAGQMMFQQSQLKRHELVVNVEDWPQGMYIVYCRAGVRRLVVE